MAVVNILEKGCFRWRKLVEIPACLAKSYLARVYEELPSYIHPSIPPPHPPPSLPLYILLLGAYNDTIKQR